jgi:superkiller protein 3
VDPGYTPALVALVKIQERKGDLDAALAGAKKVAADAPQSFEAQMQLGRILLRKNDFDGAVAALEKAGQLSPGLAEAHARLGTAYQYVRKTPEALAEYKKAVELAPSNLEYRTTLGLLLGITGQYEQGAAELKKVIASPGYQDEAAYVNLGWIYRNTKPPQTQEAVAAYKKALEIDPKSVQAALGLGWAYSYSKSYDEAISAFQKAMQIDPNTAAEANNGIAWSFFFKKDVAQAKAYAEKAQSGGRTDATLKAQIERLEQLAARGGAVTEEALAEAEAEREKERQQQNAKIDAINDGLKSKSPAARARAAQDLTAAQGSGAVPTLVYQLAQDPDWDVRIAAAKALGSLGGAARSAIPQLNQTLQSQSTVNPLAESKEELQGAMKEGDLKRAVRDALQRIQGK